MKKQLEFTEAEANVLLQILDIATKSVGLNAAGDCLYFANKLKEAFKQEEAPKLEAVQE